MMGKYPEIIWDFGTAYDFFVSLLVLHKPADIDLFSSWAAGMRQRLPARDRVLLKIFRFGLVITPPLTWLSSLPQPKNGETLLKVAKQLPALDRFYALSGMDDGNDQERDLIQKVATQGTWDEGDRDELVSVYTGLGKKKPTKQLTDKLDIWAKDEEFTLSFIRIVDPHTIGNSATLTHTNRYPPSQNLANVRFGCRNYNQSQERSLLPNSC